MKRLKHRIKLLWLKRKWVIQSIWNTEDFQRARFYLELEKEVIGLYHQAKRGGLKREIAKSEGRLEVVEWLKNMEEIEGTK